VLILDNALNTHKDREAQQIEFLLEFLSYNKNYCVCIVDMVNSTNTVMHLPDNKVSLYYSIFLNNMASIINSYDAVVVKNTGDGLLYYFPKTEYVKDEYFRDVFKCCLAMIDKRVEINTLMRKEKLPNVSYRISAEYGSVRIAKTSTSSVNDIFGSTVNICSKINSLAKANSFIIGQELYNKTKSFSEYTFTKLSTGGLLKGYNVYMISRL